MVLNEQKVLGTGWNYELILGLNRGGIALCKYSPKTESMLLFRPSLH